MSDTVGSGRNGRGTDLPRAPGASLWNWQKPISEIDTEQRIINPHAGCFPLSVTSRGPSAIWRFLMMLLPEELLLLPESLMKLLFPQRFLARHNEAELLNARRGKVCSLWAWPGSLAMAEVDSAISQVLKLFPLLSPCHFPFAIKHINKKPGRQGGVIVQNHLHALENSFLKLLEMILMGKTQLSSASTCPENGAIGKNEGQILHGDQPQYLGHNRAISLPWEEWIKLSATEQQADFLEPRTTTQPAGTKGLVKDCWTTHLFIYLFSAFVCCLSWPPATPRWLTPYIIT